MERIQRHSSSCLLSAGGQGRSILFIGEAVSLAHVGRPLVLAQWAREAGYEVHFACGDVFAGIVRDEAFKPISLRTIAPKTFYGRLGNGKFFYTAEELEAYVLAERELIESMQPGLIVSDFRLSLAISAKLSGTPLVSLNNAHWSPASVCRFSAPHSGIFSFLPTSFRDGLFSLIRPMAFRTFARPLNVIRRRFGLPTLNDFRKHYTAGDYCAYLDLPEFSAVTSLPRGHFFLGPVAWEPRNVTAVALNKLAVGNLLAYVTLGSSGDESVLPHVLRALLIAGCNIALSGVRSEQSNALFQMFPELRARCIAAPLLNPREVLKCAVVTVCHGGSGTVYQSLAAGVPVLCIPGNPDQGLVAAAVIKNGSGCVVQPRCATLSNLEVAIYALLNDPNVKNSALRLSAQIAQHDTRRCWLEFLSRNEFVAADLHSFQSQGMLSVATNRQQ